MKTKDFTIIQSSTCWIVSDGKPILKCSNSEGEVRGLRHDNVDIYFDLIEGIDEQDIFRAAYTASGWYMRDTIKAIRNGFFEVERSWTNLSDNAKDVVLIFEAATMFEPDFYLIPCVSYNGNRWGKGNEPKGLAYNGIPWVFEYCRTGLPSATFSENSEYSVGMFVSDIDEKSLISACSMEKVQNGMIHRIFWPDIEGPVSYTQKDNYGPSRNNTVRLNPNEEFTTRFYVSISQVTEKNTGWMITYDRAIDIFKKETKALFSPENVWKLGIEYARDILLRDENGISLFDMGLLPRKATDEKDGCDMKWEKRKKVRNEIGWCGQNASLANALIYDYKLNGDENSLKSGIKVLDTWERNARQSNGLFYTLYDDIIAGKKDVQVDTCNLGWGAWQMINAYELAKSINLDKPSWLEMGIALCDFFTARIDSEVIFGKTWSLEGACIEGSGTIGCFVLLPLIKAYEVTGNKEYLDCAIKGFEGYVERDLYNMECTAGALDTTCVDKETCWPLLKTALDLYEITKEDFYLESALKAGYYLLSWMYHYNVICDRNSDFSIHGYQTYGATAVSTQHHHLDPWGALICLDWLRLYKYTNDENWKTRALAAWKNSLLCISDGSLIIHGMKRPAGSQNEAYFQCSWYFDGSSGSKKGSFNDWLVSWPGAFRLITLMREKDWDILYE